MNRATRMLTLLGMGLMAGATVGAAPALAADTPAPSAGKPSTVQVQKHWDNDRDRVVGYYRTLRACERAGWIGERFNKWEDSDCERVRFGFRRGLWALEVEQNRWQRPGHGHGHSPWGGHGHGHGNGHGNGNGNGHGPWGNDGHGDHRPGHRDGPNSHSNR